MDISVVIHASIFKQYPLFSNIGNKNFLAWIGSQLKQEILTEGQRIYQDSDIIDNFYFMNKGTAVFTIPKTNDLMFALIDPEKSITDPGYF